MVDLPVSVICFLERGAGAGSGFGWGQGMGQLTASLFTVSGKRLAVSFRPLEQWSASRQRQSQYRLPAKEFFIAGIRFDSKYIKKF